MPAEIQTSLFDSLDKVAALAVANKTVKDPDQRIINLDEIQKYLNQFAENFFIQLFDAFDCSIDYMEENTVSEVNNYFSEYDGKKPENILKIFEEAYEVIEDMEDNVYFESEEAEQSIKSAYFNFLPKLFNTFKNDEEILKDQITNYSAVKIRMEGILVKIGNIKQQLAL